MANTRQIKQRISTAGNISKITKAMEMVSASKMKRAQDRALSARSYTDAVNMALATLSTATDPSLHRLLIKNTMGQPLLVVVSTDRGLCGSLNQNLFKLLIGWQKQHNGAVIAVGKKAVAFSKFYGINMHAQFTDVPDKFTTSDILPITSLVLKGYLDSTFRSVDIIFMDFVNTLTQHPKHQVILPLQAVIKQEKILAKPEKASDYVFEPNPLEILDQLLPFYVENLVYQAFLESKASEHSARMVTMKNASENANELVDELRLMFNKSRQESITKELLEITTATLSLNA